MKQLNLDTSKLRQGQVLKTFMKLFIGRNGQKFAHFMQVSFSFISMQEAHIQIGLFLPSHQGRKQRYHQCENPQKPPPPRKQTQSHTPPLQSLRVGQYIIPLPPSLSLPRIPMCFSRLGPVGEARLFCQNCLPCPPPSPSFTSAALGPGLQVLACLGKFQGKMSSTTRNQ